MGEPGRAAVSLHGLRIGVSGEPAESVRRLLAILEHFGAEPTDEDPQVQVRFDAEPADAAPPADAWTTRHLDLQIQPDPEGFWLVGPAWSARAVTRELVVRSLKPSPLHALTCALVHLLRRWGAYTLHAATLAVDGRGLLLIGPSGAGKSTLTAAMVQRGWALVSDDSVLVRAGPSVWGLRRGLFLDPTRAVAPPGASWRPCPLVEAVKEELLLPAMARADVAMPALLVFPELADTARSRFTPVDAAWAAWRLAAESRLGELDRAGLQPHLDALTALAAVPAVRAELGRDVLHEPEAVDAALRALLPAATAPAPLPWSPAPPQPMAAVPPTAWSPLPSGDALLLHPSNLDAFALDAHAAAWWRLVAGRSHAEALAAVSGSALDDGRPADAQLRSFLDAMHDAGLPLLA